MAALTFLSTSPIAAVTEPRPARSSAQREQLDPSRLQGAETRRGGSSIHRQRRRDRSARDELISAVATTSNDAVARSLALLASTPSGAHVAEALTRDHVPIIVVDNNLPGGERLAADGGYFESWSMTIHAPAEAFVDPREGASLLAHEGQHYLDTLEAKQGNHAARFLGTMIPAFVLAPLRLQNPITAVVEAAESEAVASEVNAYELGTIVSHELGRLPNANTFGAGAHGEVRSREAIAKLLSEHEPYAWTGDDRHSSVAVAGTATMLAGVVAMLALSKVFPGRIPALARWGMPAALTGALVAADLLTHPRK